MINERVTEKPFAVYGKIHGIDGATDFRRLQASVGGLRTEDFYQDDSVSPPQNPEVLGYPGSGYDKRRWPDFYKEVTPYDSPVFGYLFYRGKFLITQSYYQSEGQLAKQMGNIPRLDRPFFQTSAIEINSNRVKELYQQGLAVYPGMLLIPSEDRLYTRQARLDGPKGKIRLTSLADPEKPENRLLLGNKWLPVITRAFRLLLENDKNFVAIRMLENVNTITKVQVAHTLTYLLMAYPSKQPFSFITEPIKDSSSLRLMFIGPNEKIPPSLDRYLSSHRMKHHLLKSNELFDLTTQERRLLGRLKHLAGLEPYQQHNLWQGQYSQEVLSNDLK
jgi:hypothetical protein